MHSLLLSSFMAGSLNVDGSFQADSGRSGRGGKKIRTPQSSFIAKIGTMVTIVALRMLTQRSDIINTLHLLLKPAPGCGQGYSRTPVWKQMDKKVPLQYHKFNWYIINWGDRFRVYFYLAEPWNKSAPRSLLCIHYASLPGSITSWNGRLLSWHRQA